MKRLLFFILLGMSMSFFSCEKNESMEVEIRVRNASSSDFNNVIVQDKDFGNIASGEVSDYQTFDSAYHYAFIELQISGETFTIQPIDFVGETELAPGQYTYELNTNDSWNGQYDKLTLTFFED